MNKSAFALGLLLLPVCVGAVNCQLLESGVFNHADIGKIQLRRDSATDAMVFVSQMAVNPDGAADAYSPDDTGTVHICNGISVGKSCTWKADCKSDYLKAKSEGFIGETRLCFFAIATDKKNVPLLQGPNDPKPGYFISLSALKQPGADPKSIAGQIDSNSVAVTVIPKNWVGVSNRPQLGDYGVAYRRSTNKIEYFIVGDAGPKTKLGEGSIALHRALGNDPMQMKNGVLRARRGIAGRDVLYVMFRGSAQKSVLISQATVKAEGEKLLAKFGGIDRLKACAKS